MVQVRTRLLFGDYNKMYQNVFPGAVDSTGTLVSISAYNNRNDRDNLFSQTDLTWRAAHRRRGSHAAGRGGAGTAGDVTTFRNTGYFDNIATTVTAPLDSPTISRAVTFRPERDGRRQPRPRDSRRCLLAGPG